MGTWARDSDTGVFTLTGDGTNTAYVNDEAHAATVAVKIQSSQVTDAASVFVRSSPDGRTRWEIAIVGSNVRLQRVKFGVVQAFLESVAHGLGGGESFVLEARIIANKLQGYINGVKVLQQDIGSVLSALDRAGFAATVDGAQVFRLEECELIPEVQARSDLLVAISGGDLFVSVDGVGIQLVESSVVRSDTAVSMREHEQKAYIVDGQRAKIFDPAEMTVTEWVPTAGTLPGQTDDGTTTATIVRGHRSRIMASGSDDDPQNLVASAIGDPLDWDTGTNQVGRAFALGGAGGSRAGLVGQPIVAMEVMSGSQFVLGCTGQIWSLRGDPAFGVPEADPLSIEVGVSGMSAMTLVTEGAMLAHAPEGLLIITPASVVNITQNLLTEGIQFDRSNSALFRVQVERDTRRHGTHIFLTAELGGASTHFWYDDRMGGLQPGRGGLYPETYPDSFGPTASAVWRGKVVLGGRDGYLRIFDDTAKSDDGSTAIDAYCNVGLTLPDTIGDTLHNKTQITLAEDSDPVLCRFYGGSTPEQALGSNRYALSPPATRAFNGLPLVQQVRSPSMFLELRNSVLDEAIQIERAEVHLRPMRLKRRWGRKVIPAPPPPCGISGVPGDPVSSSGPPAPTSYSVGSGPGDTTLSAAGTTSGASTVTTISSIASSTQTPSSFITLGHTNDVQAPSLSSSSSVGQVSLSSTSVTLPVARQGKTFTGPVFSGTFRGSAAVSSSIASSGTTMFAWNERRYSNGTEVSSSLTWIPTINPATGYTWGGTYS